MISTEVPQMRTIPIEKSVTVQHAVTDYDALLKLLNDSEGPFRVGECICRKAARFQGKTCKHTSRLETCMAIGDMAKQFPEGEGWREVTREEALENAPEPGRWARAAAVEHAEDRFHLRLLQLLLWDVGLPQVLAETR